MRVLLLYLSILALYFQTLYAWHTIKSIDHEKNEAFIVMRRFKLFFFTGWNFVLTGAMFGLSAYTMILVLHSATMYHCAQLEHVLDSGKVAENLKRFNRFTFYFFTTWNFGLQIAFLVAAVLDEISKLLDLNPSIQKLLGRIRSFLFSALVLPSTLIVLTVFWVLWHIDRELIYPEAIDAFFPFWLNHMLHTFIVVPVIVELLLPKRYHFVKFWTALKAFLFYVAVYQTLYVLIYLRHGVWLYPIYIHLNWFERTLFTLVEFLIGVIAMRAGLAIQNRKIAAIQKRKISILIGKNE